MTDRKQEDGTYYYAIYLFITLCCYDDKILGDDLNEVLASMG
jgi:hypothetical protein